MKKLFAFAILLAVPAFSQTTPTPKKKAVAKAAAKPAPVAQPLVIPKDATPNPDGTFAWTDKAGKKWIFSKTPFGVSKVEDTSASGPAFASAAPGQYVKAIEVGDKVRFEHQSPFGTSKWEKNKADLTDEERAILAAQAPVQPGKQQ
mgnify:CR=1 FL=1